MSLMRTRLLLLLSVIALCYSAAHAQQKTPVAPDSDESQPILKVKSGIMEGNLMRRVDPVYPAEAKKNHLQGSVVLVGVIDKEGTMTKLRVISGDPVLAQAAIEAVQQWKYKPYTLNGEPVAVQTTVRVVFHM